MTDGQDGPLPGLDRLPRDFDPPAAARARIAGALRERGLTRADGPSPARRTRWWLQAAAAIALFVAGAAAGRAFGHDEAPQASFMLLVYGTPGGDVPEAQRVAEYTAWARDPGNRVVQADRLGAELLPAGAAPASSPSGFFLLAAPDDEAARAIARSHPHVLAGGRIALHRLR